MVKRCIKCGEEKPLEDFHVDNSKANGRVSRCKLCLEAARTPKKDEKAAWYREYYRANKPQISTRTREYAIRQKYGVTGEQFERMNADQLGLCAICGESCEQKTRLSIDHNERTGQVRQLLCRKHNAALGLFGHNTALLQRAVAYLEKHDRQWAERTA